MIFSTFLHRPARRIAALAVVACTALLAGCVVAPPQAYQVGAPTVYDGSVGYAAPGYAAPYYGGYAYPAPSISLGISGFFGGGGGHYHRGYNGYRGHGGYRGHRGGWRGSNGHGGHGGGWRR